jgi:hypothetical protein
MEKQTMARKTTAPTPQEMQQLIAQMIARLSLRG